MWSGSVENRKKIVYEHEEHMECMHRDNLLGKEASISLQKILGPCSSGSSSVGCVTIGASSTVRDFSSRSFSFLKKRFAHREESHQVWDMGWLIL